MTEEQKYQGALYKNKKAKTASNNTPSAQDNMAHRAYVEDVGEYDDYIGVTAAVAEEVLPRAPSPPMLPTGGLNINVFDYQLDPTPAQSTVTLTQPSGPSEAEPTQRNQLVRFEEPEPRPYDDLDMLADDEAALVSYGIGPLPPLYETPQPRSRERKRTDKDGKKDKKRKRLHVSTHDLDMPDAPILHSGLTGDIGRMMTRTQTFPPSPDYSGSGGEFGETPASPLKKSKHTKHHRSSRQETGGIMNNIASILTSGTSKSASKTKKRKHTSTSAPTKRHSHRTHSKRLEGAKEPKLLEYKDGNHDAEDRNGPGAMIVHYNRPADLFFSMVSKGPDSERGCSVNKVLKRFHRERSNASDSRSKPLEEKELFRSLRMRRNDRGEIVLFCV